jgi:hypothetical protein
MKLFLWYTSSLISQPYNSVLTDIHVHVNKYMTVVWLIVFRSAFIFTYPSQISIDNGVFPYKIQSLSGVRSPGVKRPGRKAGHSPVSSAKVKKGAAIPPVPYMSPWRGA